jgi:hypothetical protein
VLSHSRSSAVGVDVLEVHKRLDHLQQKTPFLFSVLSHSYVCPEPVLVKMIDLKLKLYGECKKGVSRTAAGFAETPSLRKTAFLSHLYIKNDHFAKTGSGQT